jgi:hypothetical protein
MKDFRINKIISEFHFLKTADFLQSFNNLVDVFFIKIKITQIIGIAVIHIECLVG